MPKQASSLVLGFQFNLAKFLMGDARDSVMPGEWFIEKGVIRIDKVLDTSVLLQDMSKVTAGFLAHGIFQIVLIIGTVGFRVRRHFAKGSKMQPLFDEVLT